MKFKFTDEEGDEFIMHLSVWSAMKIFVVGYVGCFAILFLLFIFIYLFTTL